MPKVRDYESGNILALIKRAFWLFPHLNTPILGMIVRKYADSELRKCDPYKVPVDYAVRLIRESEQCAVGQRVCNLLYGGADFGKSVFLDELAAGMVGAGKADYVNREEAVRAIAENRRGPIMITSVSGKHMEICRSIPRNCVYWNSEKHGLKCIGRKSHS